MTECTAGVDTNAVNPRRVSARLLCCPNTCTSPGPWQTSCALLQPSPIWPFHIYPTIMINTNPPVKQTIPIRIWRNIGTSPQFAFDVMSHYPPSGGGLRHLTLRPVAMDSVIRLRHSEDLRTAFGNMLPWAAERFRRTASRNVRRGSGNWPPRCCGGPILDSNKRQRRVTRQCRHRLV
jgi:hypothetical protein